MNTNSWIGLAAHLTIALIWMATNRGQNFKKSLPTKAHLRSAPVVTFPVLCIIQGLIPFLWFPIFPSSFLNYLGTILVIVGASIAMWAKLTMKDSWGKPAQHDVKTQKRLIIHGPFTYSRNPIYVGLFCMFLGQQLTLGSAFILLGVVFAWVIHKSVLVEEKLLTKFFGAPYSSYIKRVPRYLVIK